MNLEQKNAVTATTQDVLTHHLHSFGNLTATMADYTAESRIFTPDGLLRGPEAIRQGFAKLFEEFAKPGMSFEMLRQAQTLENRFDRSRIDSQPAGPGPGGSFPSSLPP